MEDGWKNKWNKVKKTKSISEAALKYLSIYIGKSGKAAFGKDADRLSVIQNLAGIMYDTLKSDYLGFTKLQYQDVVNFLEEDMLVKDTTIDEYVDDAWNIFTPWWDEQNKEPTWK